MFHQMLATWFRLSLEWGYAGVFLMMAVDGRMHEERRHVEDHDVE